LSYSLAHREGRLRLNVSGHRFRMPRGGIVFAPPGIPDDDDVRVDGRRGSARDGSVHIRSLPATVEMDTP
jgi:hypothetical protein